MKIERIAQIREYIVTANKDGTIPLNAKVLAKVDIDGDGTAALIAAFNKLAFIVEERDEDY